MKNFDISMFEHKRGHELDVQEKKSLMRKFIISERKTMNSAARAENSEQICELALMVDEIADAKSVAMYASRDSEPSTDNLLAILKRRGINVILPVLGVQLKRDWALFSDLSDLHVLIDGRPPEPNTGSLGEDAIADVDAIVVPALAIDANGARLGHGGGWYDRVLTKKHPDTKVFAITYDSEFYEADTSPIPVEAHDIKVNGVITPTKFVRF